MEERTFCSVLLQESQGWSIDTLQLSPALRALYSLSKRIVAWLRGERERRGKREEKSIVKYWNTAPPLFPRFLFPRRSCDFPSNRYPLLSYLPSTSRRFNQLPDAERISRAIASKTRPVSTDMRSSSYRRLSFVSFHPSPLFPPPLLIFFSLNDTNCARISSSGSVAGDPPRGSRG